MSASSSSPRSSASQGGGEGGGGGRVTTALQREEKGKKKQFIQATFAMSSNPAMSKCVHWTADGNGLEICNVTLFCENALPTYFKHQNFSSFVRQLNMYGFEKERYPAHAEGHVFHHLHFKRGRPDLLHLITRKVLQKSEKKPDAASSSSVVDEVDQRVLRLESENSRLEAENKRLKVRFFFLLLERLLVAFLFSETLTPAAFVAIHFT